MYNLINFDEFPTVHGKIIIPKNTILYRGYDTNYTNISNRPAYFTSNKKLAKSYAKLTNTGVLGTFVLNHDIVLYDLRYIKTILLDIFGQTQSNSSKIIEICSTLALSYGLCSFNRQIDLFKIRYRNIPVDKEEHIKKINFTLQNVKYDFDKNIINGQTMDLIDPIEPKGFRFGETDNDSQSLLILNKLFDGHIDGYIAPNFNSPFHIENSFKIHSEIVLFNPVKCNIKQINIVKTDTIQNMHIIDYMTKYNTVHFNLEGFNKPSLIMKGGFTNTNNIRNPNELFDNLSNTSYYELKTTIDNTVIHMLNGKRVEYNITLPKSLKDTKYERMPKLTVSPWSSNGIPLQLSFE
jgi:hypothetical protein